MKTGNLSTGQNRQFPPAETTEFYFVPWSVRKSVCTFVRQVSISGNTVASVAKALDINYLLAGLFQPVRTVVFAPFFLLGAALAYRSDWDLATVTRTSS